MAGNSENEKKSDFSCFANKNLANFFELDQLLFNVLHLSFL